MLIALHDVTMTAAALVASFYIRFEENGLADRIEALLKLLPAILIYSAFVFWMMRLSRAKWRFTSLPDFRDIVLAATVLAGSILILDYLLVSSAFFGQLLFGKITIALFWLLEMAFLAGPRIAYRYFRYTRTRQHIRADDAVPALIVGVAADADILLRGIESGAIRKMRPVGMLSPSRADQQQSLRGVPVLGLPGDLEAVLQTLASNDIQVAQLLMTPSALEPQNHPETIVMRARRLGLAARRMLPLSEGGDAFQLLPIQIDDLLLRPSVEIDFESLERFVRGRAVLVTGGGGSIGAEICHRIVALGASRLLILENSEAALYAVLEQLAAKNPVSKIEGRLVDVRDREQTFQMMAAYKPDIVFHAAALKHVPLLENDWREGVRTNVFGSMVVTDAAVAAGAAVTVMISTDKAVEPVSVLGITKRVAEMYCQALDAEIARKNDGEAGRARIVSVRFGNVLASNGSVVPKFRAQIEAGGPVTLTHPEMVRYFMTIREACNLVIAAATHALSSAGSDVAVYVLNMGQPVKIAELADRMIRLSGLEPGRDIEVVHVGMRPGERLHEKLFAIHEKTTEIGIPGIMAASTPCPAYGSMSARLGTVEEALRANDRDRVLDLLRDIVSDGETGRPVATAAPPAISGVVRH